MNTVTAVTRREKRSIFNDEESKRILFTTKRVLFNLLSVLLQSFFQFLRYKGEHPYRVKVRIGHPY